ncbi:MAG: Dabb family protein [Verrucomicrobiales bacterium]|nr:Dabb family protein [Verrucomicrobiales bacterium]
MVHYIALFRVGKDTTEEDLEEMIRVSRTCFHRVNEAHNFRSGRSIDKKSEFGFFISADFESREKLAMFLEDPNYRRFDSEVIEVHTTAQVTHTFETEPGKDPKYS